MTESESQKRCAGLHSWFPKLFAFLWGSNPIMYRGFIILDLVANSQKLVKITAKENPSFQTGRCFPREEFPNFYCKSRHQFSSTRSRACCQLEICCQTYFNISAGNRNLWSENRFSVIQKNWSCTKWSQIVKGLTKYHMWSYHTLDLVRILDCSKCKILEKYLRNYLHAYTNSDIF